MVSILSLVTQHNEYLAIVYSFSGPSQLPFTCQELFVASVPFLKYHEDVSEEVGMVIAKYGSAAQREKLFCCRHVKVIEMLLKDRSISPTYRRGRALRVAVKNNCRDVVSLLLEDRRIKIGDYHEECLVLAAKMGHVKMVRRLVKHGAQLDGMNFVKVALGSRHKKMIQFVIKQFAVSKEILEYAVKFADPYIIEVFLADEGYRLRIEKSHAVLRLMLCTNNPAVITLMTPYVVKQWKKTIVPSMMTYYLRQLTKASIIAFNDALIDAGVGNELLLSVLRYNDLDHHEDVIDIISGHL